MAAQTTVARILKPLHLRASTSRSSRSRFATLPSAAMGSLVRQSSRVLASLLAVGALGSSASAAVAHLPKASPERPAVLSGPEASASPSCSRSFCVHWTATGEDAPPLEDTDGDGVPDYVKRATDYAESSLDLQVSPAPRGLGWKPPVPDGSLGGGVGKIDVYVDRFAGEGGYVYFDHGTGYERSAWMGVSNGLLPTDMQRVVTHELNHVLQFGSDAFQQGWMFEATATWVEQRLHGSVFGGNREVARWAAQSRVPLIGPSEKRYGSRVWNAWLVARFGDEVVARAWKESPKADPRRLSAPAFEAAIGRPGGFAQEFGRFAAATAEWRSTNGPWPDATGFPDVARDPAALVEGQEQVLELDHTTFSLLDVPSLTGPVSLRVSAPEGMAAAVALVGRQGTAEDGAVTTDLVDLPAGGTDVVRLDDVGRYQRVTAVVVNADAEVTGGEGSAAEWRDDQPFAVELVRPAGGSPGQAVPFATTGTPPALALPVFSPPARAPSPRQSATRSLWRASLSTVPTPRTSVVARGARVVVRTNRLAGALCTLRLGRRQLASRRVGLALGRNRVTIPLRAVARRHVRPGTRSLLVNCRLSSAAQTKRRSRSLLLR